MALPPFKKKSPARSVESKRDPMPKQVKTAAKRDRSGGVSRDAFSATVTDTSPRMPRQVRGK